MNLRTLTAGTALGIVSFAAIVFLLSATEAGALPKGIEPTADEVSAAEECAHKATGLPIPETPVKVVYSDEWSRKPDGICCDRMGQRVYQNGQTVSTLSVQTRTITIYRAAGFPQLVHEVAADMWIQANNPWQYQKWEPIGYRAEWYAQECNQ